MSEVMEPETRQPCLLRKGSPSRAPAHDVPGGVKFRQIGPDNLSAVEDSSGDVGRKDVMLRLCRTERFCPRPYTNETLNETVPIDQILKDPHRVAPALKLQRDLGAVRSQALDEYGPDLEDALIPFKKPVVTSMAGFESATQKPVITSLAGFELSEPVITSLAAFAGGLRPQPPGVRRAIPADLK